MTILVTDLEHQIRTLRCDEAPAFLIGIGSNGLSFLRSLGRPSILLVAGQGQTAKAGNAFRIRTRSHQGDSHHRADRDNGNLTSVFQVVLDLS